MPVIQGNLSALKQSQPFDIVLYPVEKRGGRWGWFQEGPWAGSRFIAPNVQTKRDAEENRTAEARRFSIDYRAKVALIWE